MKRNPLLLAAVLFLGGNFALGWLAIAEWKSGGRTTAEAESNCSGLQFPRSRIDLGRIRVGESREFSMTVRNVSDQPVKVERVLASCGCANARIEPQYIAPGGTAELKGRIAPKFSPGDLTVKITPIFQSAGRPQTVAVVATIVSLVELSPAIVQLQPSLTGAASRAELSVQNRSTKPIELASLTPLPGGVRLEPSSTVRVPAGGRAQFAVRAEYSDPVERRVTLHLRTGLSAEPLIELPVDLRPRPSLRISPAQIDFGIVSRAEFSRKNMVRVRLTGEALRLLTIDRVDVPRIVASHRIVSDVAGTAELSLRFRESPRRTSLDSHVVIQFRSNDAAPAVHATIPVSGLLTDPVTSSRSATHGN